MIGVRISGGLGNQMFQYAFADNAALKTKTTFFLDKEGLPVELYKYFKLKKNIWYYIDTVLFNHSGFKLLLSHYSRKKFYAIVIAWFIKKRIAVSNTDQPERVLNEVNDKTFYEGYFQSPVYFQNNLKEVQTLFELKSSIKNRYKKKYAFPDSKNKVVIHIRKTDYNDLKHLNLGGSDLSLPFAYYHRLISKIDRGNNYYIFISDEPALIKSEFGYLKDMYISEATAIIDFQHMLYANICIIANSTFSWWAAYLNQITDHIVYCPQYFLGHLVKTEYPVSIYPDSWLQVPVYDADEK